MVCLIVNVANAAEEHNDKVAVRHMEWTVWQSEKALREYGGKNCLENCAEDLELARYMEQFLRRSWISGELKSPS